MTSLGIFTLPPRVDKTPKATSDGKERTLTSDVRMQDTMISILRELQKINVHLSYLTKEDVTEDDLEDT